MMKSHSVEEELRVRNIIYCDLRKRHLPMSRAVNRAPNFSFTEVCMVILSEASLFFQIRKATPPPLIAW